MFELLKYAQSEIDSIVDSLGDTITSIFLEVYKMSSIDICDVIRSTKDV